MAMLLLLGFVAIGTALSVAFSVGKDSSEGLKRDYERAPVAAMDTNSTDAITPVSGGLRGKSFNDSQPSSLDTLMFGVAAAAAMVGLLAAVRKQYTTWAIAAGHDPHLVPLTPESSSPAEISDGRRAARGERPHIPAAGMSLRDVAAHAPSEMSGDDWERLRLQMQAEQDMVEERRHANDLAQP